MFPLKLRQPFNLEQQESVSSGLILRDLPYGVVPAGSGKVKAILTESTPALLELVTDALDSDADDLLGAVEQFFAICAARLLDEGHSIYELKMSSEPGPFNSLSRRTRLEYGPARRVLLEWCSRDKLSNRFGKIYLRERDTNHQIIERLLPKKDQIRLSSPKIAGMDLHTICREISRIESQSLARMQKETLKGLSTVSRRQSSQFDYAKHTKISDTALLHAATALGWNFDNLIDTEITRYYQAVRFLRLKKYLARTRACILRGVNDALAIAGDRMNFKTKLVIQGLPSEADVDHALNLLASGTSIPAVLSTMGP